MAARARLDCANEDATLDIPLTLVAKLWSLFVALTRAQGWIIAPKLFPVGRAAEISGMTQ